MSKARLILLCCALLTGLGYSQEQRPALLYSTYLGGSGNERGDAIAVDREGNVYVAGVTSSTDFPTTEGAFRRTVDPKLQCNNFSDCPNAIYVTKLSADGQKILWSTYLHQGYAFGSHGMRVDDLQVDAAGEVYLAGTTSVNGFPTTPGAFERSCPAYDLRIEPVCAFVAKLSRDGSELLFSSFFGANILGMTIRKLRLDDAGNVILGGHTFAAIAFVAKLDPQFSTLLFIRRLGGTGHEQVVALEVDASGIYVGGGSRSSNFPATPGALKSHLTGEADGFVTKLSHAGGVIFSTLVGGSGYDAVTALRVDSSGSILVGGRTESGDFPVSPGAYQMTFAGGRDDAFVAALSGDGSRVLFSTFLGGEGDPIWTSGEVVLEVARASDGSVQVVGRTRALDFPLKNSVRLKPVDQCRWRGGCSGIFVASFDAMATELLASTVLGSPGEDSVWGVAWAENGWWITGDVLEGFPITPDALQPTDGGAGRAFVAQLFAGAQDFTMEVAASPLGLVGGRGTTTILLAAAPAFGEEITLSCENLPASYSCHFSPSKVFIGAGKRQVVLTIGRNSGLAAMSMLLAPFGLALGLRRRWIAGRRWLLALVLIAISLFAGCRGIVQPGLFSQSMAVKIVAQSQTVTHSALLQLSADPR